MRFWPSAVAGGFFILRGKRAGAKGEGKNPAVTALPCQGPLGKRVMGEEGTDCHDQFANWSRNDRFFARGVVGRATARVAPTEGYKRVQQSGPSGTPAPTEALQGVQWAGDRKGRPYEVLRGMCGLGIGPCGGFLTGREWYVSDFGGGG